MEPSVDQHDVKKHRMSYLVSLILMQSCNGIVCIYRVSPIKKIVATDPSAFLEDGVYLGEEEARLAHTDTVTGAQFVFHKLFLCGCRQY